MKIAWGINVRLLIVLCAPCLTLAATPTGSIGGHEAAFVDVNGINTRYYDVGSGDVIVLVHGGPWEGTSSANDWVPSLSTLAGKFRVLAPDRLANGMTDNPGRENEDLFNDRGQIDHIAQFIETMGVGPVNLVGHGSGSAVLFLAQERPDLVKSLVLVSATRASPPLAHDGAKQALAECPWQMMGEKTAPWMDQLECILRKFSYDDSHVTEEHMDALSMMNLQPKVQWTRFYRDGGAGEPFRSNFDHWRAEMHARIREEGELTMPVLLIWPKQDPLFPRQQAMALFDVLGAKNSRVQMIVMNDSGHFPFREKPDEFADVVIRFISGWRAVIEF